MLLGRRRRASTADSIDTNATREIEGTLADYRSSSLFSTDDLGIDSLQSLGEMTIQWTSIASEHLKFHVAGSRNQDTSASSADSDRGRSGYIYESGLILKVF